MNQKSWAKWIVPAALSVGTVAIPTSASASVSGLLASAHSVKPNVAIISPVTDLGPADSSQNVTLSVILKAQNLSGLAKYIDETVTPSSKAYHQFLTVSQFRSQYAPASSSVDALVQYFDKNGLQSYAEADGLMVKAEGPAWAFEKLFKLSIENYETNGEPFYAASRSLTFPKQFSKLILTTVGLDNYAVAAPQMMTLANSPEADATTQPVTLPKKGTSNHIPGQFTVGDVADRYDVNRLYKAGISGKGETIGIATFANFHVQDAYHYWKSIHLNVQPGRVRQVFVDGGGVIAKDASGETALDVEQSGGLAPDANVVVYDASNSDEGFIDMFYQAASDNVVDTLSMSWGSPELFYLAGQQTSELQALHQAFMENAAQGITTVSAAGDSGAYDVNAAIPYPFVSRVISVDVPSSDPYVTAAGGVTLAGSYKMKHGWVDVPETRAWGWDYLTNYFNQYYGPYGLYTNNIFPAGGGGGVSAVWGVPDYQKGMPAIQTTQPGQDLIDNTQNPPSDFYSIKAGFAGRNTPDISLNADPYSGYLIYSSPDGGWVKNVGGTSVAAPQFAGMLALADQSLGGRLGMVNPVLYQLAKSNDYGPGAPLTDVTAGDNWFYNAIPGYDQASGVGTPNLANLVSWLKEQAPSSTTLGSKKS